MKHNVNRRSALSATAAASVAALCATPAALAAAPKGATQGASIVGLYKKPADPAKFDAYYEQHHTPLAKTLPGLQSYIVSRGLNDSAPYYLVAVLTFPSMDALKAAIDSPQGKDVIADFKNFAQAGVDVLTFENVPV
jgi:uncharacterized protein (TIGR02118 family)